MSEISMLSNTSPASAYQVLARKWRPANFQQMVGQEHIITALTNALTRNQLHHAYLFSGTRGVGKTTLGRILAKSLNCSQGVTATPCEVCEACQLIAKGRFIDLIEIDAASRTKVEDTRELLENINYLPTQGRYKIYLIDEVHMLSGHSFNALLKTLEEPPAHVKFILATTEPQRLPITVLSRCLQFNLKPIPVEQITQQLQKIVTQEQIPYEIEALSLVSTAANGSIRDALSLLDQAIAYGNYEIKTAALRDMLGLIDNHYNWRLLTAIAQGDAQTLHEIVIELTSQGVDFQQALESLLTTLHEIALLQVLPNHQEASESPQERLAKELLPEDVQLYYQIGLMGRRDLPLAPTPVTGFEMILLRMLAFRPVQAIANPEFIKPATSNKPVATTNKLEATPANLPPLKTAESQQATRSNFDWALVLQQLQLTGLCATVAANCALLHKTNDLIELTLEASHQSLLSPKIQQQITEALEKYLGHPIKLTISAGTQALLTPARIHKQAQEQQYQATLGAIEREQPLQDLLQRFNATIETDTIQSYK